MDILRKLGLTDQQISIYLMLIKTGAVSVNNLTKRLNISRISCYDTINRLVAKGLVTIDTLGSHRLFKAISPDELVRKAREIEEDARNTREKIEKLIPSLKKLESTSSEQSFSFTYIGIEGMKSFFESILRTKDNLLVIGATGKALTKLEYYFPQWHRKRIIRKIYTKVIFNYELRGSLITKISYSEIRFLNKKQNVPSTIFIFGNHVANLLWLDNPVCFVITSQEITQSYRKYFEQLWNLARK